MLSILSFLLFFIAFLVFVRWDRRRIDQGAPDTDIRQKIQNGWNASQSAKYQGAAGVAAIAAVSAISQWLSPNLPPFTGRWSWLNIAAYEAFGTYGMAFVTTVASLAFAISAWSLWKQVRRPIK
ncbi:hypothetical protein [Sulfuricella sp. T08]|uniref:hypothetical protein n=1 Tax=Sulfuricella sp. T08 TaxID=1632857 RepID=UPI001184EDA7|nr:hypothetical protein [Sulfuricella sp. T08]